MRISKLFIAATAVAVALSGVELKPAYAGDQQCWRSLSHPQNACPVCASTCGGAGFRCCTIVADP